MVNIKNMLLLKCILKWVACFYYIMILYNSWYSEGISFPVWQERIYLRLLTKILNSDIITQEYYKRISLDYL